MNISNKILRIKTYIKVGELLHLIGIISLLLFIIFYKLAIWQFEKHHIFLTIVYGYFSYLTFWITIFAELDARSRFQNYKQVKDQIFKYGFQLRILRPMLNSRCQRDAVLVACSELGFCFDAKDYFYKIGYRWYHIIPDFVFSQPKFLLSWAFWRTTFFVPRYVPEIDYLK